MCHMAVCNAGCFEHIQSLSILLVPTQLFECTCSLVCALFISYLVLVQVGSSQIYNESRVGQGRSMDAASCVKALYIQVMLSLCIFILLHRNSVKNP